MASGTASVANNLVAFNGRYGVSSVSSTISTFSHNDLYGNAEGDTSGYTAPSGQGSLSADPKFVRSFSPGPDTNYGTQDDVPGDFHLQAGSPAIDAGDDSVVTADDTDEDGHSRTAGSHVDMGAYEYGAFSTWHVSPAGSDAGSGRTWATAKKTVGAALASAQGTDEVWVAKGTYTETIAPPAGVGLYGGFAGTETQRSQRSAKTNPTVLDGGGSTSQPVVSCSYANITVDGFTIRSGEDGVDVAGTATLSRNTISGNVRDGVFVFGGTVTLIGNTASGNGRDGMFLFGTATLTNNTVSGNISDGVYIYGTAMLTNNLVAFNGAAGLDQPYFGAISAFSHNDVYGNMGGDTSGYTPPGGQGNSSVDPLFVNRGGGNFHLMPGSPCVDAGDDPAVTAGEMDLDGKPRILGAHVDIGAYEYDAAHPPFTIANMEMALQTAGGLAAATGDDRTRLDVNVDGLVSLQDAAGIARKVAGLDTNP
jgi:parallel beta-helix repeat protein